MARPESSGRATHSGDQRYLTGAASLADRLKSLPLYPLPQHAVSRLTHRVTRSRRKWLRRALTRWFIRRFGVDMGEALEPDPDAYPDFNSFFTRALKPGARPMPEDDDALCCPADGAVSALGHLHDQRIIQAKGQDYSLVDLLGGSADRAAPFLDGAFATIYLSPANYHRVHMPAGGTLREMVHIPGRLFSVGRHTVRTVPRLFARNERVACLFDTSAGPMAMVLVGAINVGSIETTWAGEVTPPRGRALHARRYDTNPVQLERGEEMGRFNMGSTVILLFPPATVTWKRELDADVPVRLHQALGTLRPGA
ncbi:phosphatidylserine decarboxylase [Aquisalimonas sp. 2447]|uniref:archaetidylserine decarboxylase n=1 Tax=Aquisalimonas sp. 2447 TaxID=2740807 RepID=UPI0014323479|nr:archaetidylserine decarboxylase [Aquisalimonas sp. 2447]QIT54696.1 phosphatidylserine decarboxylase [Aquisalimonas sp. 2447]